MRQKLKLKQADNFDSWVAAREMSGMLVKYLDGQPHAKSIGSEQGIDGWDDFVIEEYDESCTYVQVKRQETDFSEHPENREKSLLVSGANKGNKHDLSAFDEAIRDLGKLYLVPNAITEKKRKFRLEIPAATTKIKKDTELRHFHALCERCRNETTTEAKLKESADAADLRMFHWLTTWCEFQDWGHIFRTLKALSLSYTSLESDLKNAIDNELGAWFNPAADARQAIYHYIQDHSTDTGAATPRLILEKLTDFFRTDKPRWLHYSPSLTPLSWQVSGIVSHNSERELPIYTVPFLWDGSSGLGRNLRIGGDLPNRNLPPLQLALMRLALHLPRPALASVSNADAYKTSVNFATAGTLGCNLIGSGILPITTDRSTFSSSAIHVLNGTSETITEGEKLHSEMDKVTWRLVRKSVTNRVSMMPNDGDLQQAVSGLWQTWNTQIENHPTVYGKLLLDMLSVVSEGKNVQSLLRVGPETVELLANCLWMHLIVSVSLDGSGAELNKLNDGRKIKALALSFWGGPAGTANGPRALMGGKFEDEDAELLGKETDPILIFSGTTISPNEIFPTSLADDLLAQDSLAAPHRPDLMITNCRNFNKLVQKNWVEPIKMHLKDELEKVRESREKNIQGIRK